MGLENWHCLISFLWFQRKRRAERFFVRMGICINLLFMSATVAMPNLQKTEMTPLSFAGKLWRNKKSGI